MTLTLMQGRPVDKLLNVAVECLALHQLQVEVGRSLENRVRAGLSGDDREHGHVYEVDEASSHQRAVQRDAAVRAQRNFGLLLEPVDDVYSFAAHDGRVGPVEESFQRRRHYRRWHVPHPGDPRVSHLGLLGARGNNIQKLLERGGSEDQPLLRVERGEAAAEQLGALLAPVAAPVAVGAIRAVAIKGRKDVESVGSGHDVFLNTVDWMCFNGGYSKVAYVRSATLCATEQQAVRAARTSSFLSATRECPDLSWRCCRGIYVGEYEPAL